MSRRPLPRLFLFVLFMLTASCASTSQHVSSEPAAHPGAGNWSEQWGDPATSDVTYHDQYTVQAGASQAASVRITNRDQLIEKVDLADGLLRFVLHTDTTPVRFELQWDAATDRWVGQAHNDQGTFSVVWTRAP